MGLSRTVLAAALVAASLAGRARVEAGPDDPFETRLLDVLAITQGHSDHRGRRPRRSMPADDEANPLFGGEAEETRKPFGGIEDVIEHVKAADAEAWTREGSSIQASGVGQLLVTAPRSTLDATGEVLGSLEREATTVVEIDVVRFAGDPASVRTEGLEAARARGLARVLARARVTAAWDQRAAVFGGADRALVEEEDVELAKGVSTTDPIVGVGFEGLAFDARATASGDDLLVSLVGWHAQPMELVPRAIGPGDPVETETQALLEFPLVVLRVRPDRWTPFSTSRDGGCAVRAHVRAPSPSRPVLRAAVAGAHPATRPARPATFDVADLLSRSPRVRGAAIELMPSNYTPPEPPELAEPRPAIEREILLDLVGRRLGTDPDGSIEIDGTPPHLRLRASAEATLDLRAWLADVRRRTLRSFRLRGTWVSLPVASLSGGDALADLDPALLARAGAGLRALPGARVVADTDVVVPTGGRRASVAGRERQFVGDYDVEVAEKAAIGNPIVKTVLDGVSFDVEAVECAGGASLVCDVRLDEASWRGSRLVETRHGAIECPSIGVRRVAGTLVVPVGGTVVAGLWIDGDQATVALLSAERAD